MKIIAIGATGFIGRHVVSELAGAGHGVAVVHRGSTPLQAGCGVDENYDKVQVEEAIRSDPELPATVLRLPMVYGPEDPLHRLFPVVKRIEDRRPVILYERSHAQFVPCRGYVENVAHAIAMACAS